MLLCATHIAGAAGLKLYWHEDQVGIRRANFDGSQAETIYSTTENVAYLAASKSLGKMFYAIGSPTPQIWSADLDGQNRQLLATFDVANYVRGLTFDEVTQKLYWSSFHGINSSNGQIRSADVDGTNIQAVLSLGETRPFGMAIDSASARMFWANSGQGIVQRANLNGTSKFDLVSVGGLTSTHMTLDPVGQKLYWTTPADNSIWWSNFDGSQASVIAPMGGTVPYDSGITVDHASGYLFWSETTTDRIFRAGLDGSDPTVILSGLNNPGPMFVLVPEPTTSSLLLASLMLGAIIMFARSRLR